LDKPQMYHVFKIFIGTDIFFLFLFLLMKCS
jgi:hypothetical protein